MLLLMTLLTIVAEDNGALQFTTTAISPIVVPIGGGDGIENTDNNMSIPHLITATRNLRAARFRVGPYRTQPC